LRTLIEEIRPSTRSVMIELLLLALDLLDDTVDDGDDHGALPGPRLYTQVSITVSPTLVLPPV
jgi:hypothetical protein